MKPEKVVETRAGYMAFEETEQGPKVLQIFGNSGHYYFQDIGKLWKFSEGVERYPPKLAESRTTSFLQERGLYPEDTGPWSVESEEISEVESRSGEVRTTHYQGTCTVYTRVKTASGNTSTAVYGPGGRMKVYIYEDGQIMGALGNWRDVNYKEEVSSMNAEDAWLLFEKYGRAISVAPIYADYEGVETNLKDAGQAYYEASPLKKQAILTPVWVFDVNFVTNEQVTDEALVYIPVSQDLFPPLTEITSPDNGAEVNYGETVDFSCRTLSGFGTSPFTYNWESSVDGFLSNEQNFKTSELSINCPAVACDCSAQPHMITLKVRDAYGTEFTTSVQLTVKGPCPDCMHCADLNTDGLIDLKDFARLAGSWLTERGNSD
jgi:hypothetical protein